ncbi:SAM-dependent methyltransferase [Aquimarina sp. AD10]|uniref:O-methyltransferase n=1 Tax=Aquimarina sp. AD10 TaxID=1714849 RepID=UPI000E4A0565|nr:class I SAM-dependent methyltransferase [Aquimarina sp. AD10]AXT61437.1 SAM-dependent methyltransferase [Aquimarina sp. AD10]RKM89922.1 SAM-dependent methyltransferase [Aquimarina sp. AD10]
MNDSNITDFPKVYSALEKLAKEIHFSMPSDPYIGTLLKTLITSKPNANILELGTGIGLSLSWMITGMDDSSKLTTLDNDPKLIKSIQEYFKNEERVTIINTDGATWIKNYTGQKFDLIFADTWPGKFYELEETLALVKPNGFYVIDDMITQSNWPVGHQQKVDQLIKTLENRKDFNLTKMNWASGIIIATKKT